jgi:hypothetical protein
MVEKEEASEKAKRYFLERDSIDKVASLIGLVVYDLAIPQGWIEKVRAHGFMVLSGDFVWCYDTMKMFGEPIPVTKRGFDIFLLLPEDLRGEVM